MLELFRTLFALPPAGSSFALGIDLMHFLVIGTTLLSSVGIATYAALQIARYRAKTLDQPTPHLVVTKRRETLIVSSILGLFLVFWIVGFRQYVEMQKAPTNARTVYVTAKQWMWKFSYPDGHNANDVLTLQVDVPVNLIMTSRDVIHSFFVPAFRAKQDVLPGRYVTIWFKPVAVGVYPIFCAEYCGVSHSNMLGEVRVLSAVDYQRWLEDSVRGSEGMPNLVEVGRAAALRHACFACHTIDGQPHIGPTWSRLYGSVVALTSGEQVIADPAYLTRSMMDPQAEIVAGYRPVMPTYLGTLSQTDVAAVVEYIRSLANGPVQSSVALPRLQYDAVGGAAGANPATRGARATAPDAGNTTPDARTTTSGANTTKPDAGNTTPDARTTTSAARTTTSAANTTKPDARGTTPMAVPRAANTADSIPKEYVR